MGFPKSSVSVHNVQFMVYPPLTADKKYSRWHLLNKNCNFRHECFFRRVSKTPTTTTSQKRIAIHLQFAPIYIAVLLGKSWWLWSPGCSPIFHNESQQAWTCFEHLLITVLQEDYWKEDPCNFPLEGELARNCPTLITSVSFGQFQSAAQFQSICSVSISSTRSETQDLDGPIRANRFADLRESIRRFARIESLDSHESC